MADPNSPPSFDSGGTPVVGIRTDVYERRLELIWMTKDDIEHFESRIGDKTLFQNIALFFLSASVPLLIEKAVDYNATDSQVDLALVIVCAAGVLMGGLFQIFATSRRRKIGNFKDQLFKRDRKLSTTLTMVDTSASATEHETKGAA